MYNHHLQRMAEAVLNAMPFESDTLSTLEQIRLALAGCWKNRIAVTWNTEDVISRGKEYGGTLSVELTEEQARAVLCSVLQEYDAARGIDWDVIDEHIFAFRSQC